MVISDNIVCSSHDQVHLPGKENFQTGAFSACVFYYFVSSQVKIELHKLGRKVLQVAIEGKRSAMGEFIFKFQW